VGGVAGALGIRICTGAHGSEPGAPQAVTCSKSRIPRQRWWLHALVHRGTTAVRELLCCVPDEPAARHQTDRVLRLAHRQSVSAFGQAGKFRREGLRGDGRRGNGTQPRAHAVQLYYPPWARARRHHLWGRFGTAPTTCSRHGAGRGTTRFWVKLTTGSAAAYADLLVDGVNGGGNGFSFRSQRDLKLNSVAADLSNSASNPNPKLYGTT